MVWNIIVVYLILINIATFVVRWIDKWKSIIANEINIDKELIEITNFREGSIVFDVIFKTHDYTDNIYLQNGQKIEIKEKLKNIATTHPEIIEIFERNIIQGCKLSLDMLDSRGNQYSGYWAPKGEKRGGFEYFPPDDKWIGYGLKVKGQYENDDWIAMNGNPNEWAVAYHGTSQGAVKPVLTGKFWSSREEGAYGQACENCPNCNPLSQGEYPNKCGEGTYCSPHLEYADGYSKGVIFMCRVNPKKVRIPRGPYQENEWIVDGTKNSIRPYRLLFKKPWDTGCLLF